VLRFWRNLEITKFPQKFCLKFGQNFRQYFASFLSYFPAAQKISWEITYTMPSGILIFVKIVKLQFLSKFWILWLNSIFRAKIFTKLSLKYWHNFQCRNTIYSLYITNKQTHTHTTKSIFIYIRKHRTTSTEVFDL